jgi:Ala-tRNA(Pro) deacylase
MFAKTVLLTGDEGTPAIAVVPATDLVDLGRAAVLLGLERVRLLSEDEMTALAPGCEVGTVPPVGTLFGLPVIADHGIHGVPEVVFHAGSHSFCVRVDRAAWEREAHVRYGRISIRPEQPPPWSQS